MSSLKIISAVTNALRDNLMSYVAAEKGGESLCGKSPFQRSVDLTRGHFANFMPDRGWIAH